MTVSGHFPAGFSLLFPVALRPGAADVAGLARESRHTSSSGNAFAISHRPPDAEGWVELLAHGLTFDLVGLAPADPAPVPQIAHAYGLPAADSLPEGEWISLLPGQHLSGGQNLVPVVRAMAAAALALAGLPGVAAVAWGPGRTVLSPEYFRRSVGGWLAGGAFPALGLTALLRDENGAIVSEGLGFFTGQELRVDPILARSPAAAAKIAVRLIHSLVDGWQVQSPVEIAGPDGDRLGVEPSANGRTLRIWRTS